MPEFKYSFPFEEFMSTSLVELQVPLLSSMPVQTAWKAFEKAASVIAANQETPFQLSEAEFPFLDSKPEIDEYKPKVNKNKGGKKRSGQTYVLKQVVGQGQRGKAIGKKRRARLLSENSMDMNLNVPYSMNRNKRWELDTAADFLEGRHSNENVQLSALDQHFTVKGLSPSKDVLAFHQVNEDGILNSRKSQSQRGSTLSELNVLCDEKPLNIRYVLAKAHPNERTIVAGSFDKAKPLARSTKRAQLDISIYSSTDNDETNDDEIGLLSPGSAAHSEEISKMYSAPRQQTYSLSDFVLDKQEPIMVRTRSRHVPLDSYVQVEMPEVQEDVDHPSTPKSPMAELGQTNSLFKTLYVPCQSLEIESQDDWLQQCAPLMENSELRFRWLNNAKCNFQVDLTSQLMTSKTPHLVCTAAYERQNKRVRLLLNGSQECQANMAMIEAALASQLNGLDGLLQVVAKNSKVSKTENPTTEMSNANNAEFYSVQMSTVISPLDDYSLVYAPKMPITAVLKNEVDEEEEDDFEHIDMDAFIDSDLALDSKWKDSALDEQVAQMKTLCDECGENETTKIILFDSCAHSFCTRCLKASLYQQVCENNSTLSCSFKNCTTEVPLPVLFSIFELPILKSILHSCAKSKAKHSNNQLFACPTGCGLAILESENNKFGQVQCNTCKHHYCADCRSAPHWPLNCQQNAVWTRKRDLQSQKSSNDDGKNEITQQFWSVCDEARKRRTDAQQIRKLTKDVLKRLGYKLERQFLELRKAILQLVENGYAWLYMNRGNRPQNWQSVKTNLSLLYKKLNQLESSLLNNASGADNTKESIQKVRVTLNKTVAEIQSN